MVYLLIIFVTILLSGFFSSSETALMKISPNDLESDKLNKIQRNIIEDLIKNPSELLVTILIGNNLVNILGTAVASVFFVSLLGETFGLTASTIFMTIAVLIFAEITPKAIASVNPISVAKHVSVPLFVIHKIATPFNFIFKKTINPLIDRLKGEEGDKEELLQEFYSGINQVVNQESDAIEVISSTIEASELRVKDIMTNRANIVALPEDMDKQLLYENIVFTRFTRFPIFKETIDQIVGIIHLKDIVRAMQDDEITLDEIILPVYRIPENTPILRALRGLQESSTHLAIVKDEYGNTSGMITIEDIMEEFFGEIRDEYDDEEFENIKKLSDYVYESKGDIQVKDFNKETEFDISSPTPGITIAGLILSNLSRIPREGESFAIGNYQFKVVEIENNKLTKIRVEKIVI